MRRGIVALLLAAVGASQTGSAADGPLRLGFAGDLMMSYEMTPWLEAFGPHYPFRATEGLWRRFDLFCVNLECPISDAGLPLQNKSYYFRSEPWTVAGLLFAGVGLVSLANNHILDFGDVALFRTQEVLDRAGILWVGAGRNREEAWAPRLVERKGVRLAFLAFNLVGPEVYTAGPDRPGVAVCDAGSLAEAVRRAKAQADHVVVMFHWGEEYSSRPNAEQVGLGRAAVDAGASVVVGCHPHVVQPVEIYRGRPLAYSLGNYVFGSWGRPPERTADAGLFLEVELSKDDVAAVRVWPVDVFNHDVKFHPRPCRPAAAERVLGRVLEGEGWVRRDGGAERYFRGD